MRILVTGGAGFIGSNLTDHLLSLGHDVVVMDDLSTGFAGNINPAAGFLEMDIRTREAHDAVRSPGDLSAQQMDPVVLHRIQIAPSRTFLQIAVQDLISFFCAVPARLSASRCQKLDYDIRVLLEDPFAVQLGVLIEIACNVPSSSGAAHCIAA